MPFGKLHFHDPEKGRDRNRPYLRNFVSDLFTFSIFFLGMKIVCFSESNRYVTSRFQFSNINKFSRIIKDNLLH